MRAEPTGSRGTPLDPSQAVLALDSASDREQIFDVLLRAARSRADFVALLSVHPDHLRGRRAHAGEHFDCSRVETLRIARNAVPAFENVIASRAPAAGSWLTGEAFVDGLLEGLGGSPPGAVVLPVTVANRTVALVVAHRGDSGLEIADVADLIPLVHASSPALARVLAARAKSVGGPRTRTEADYEVEVTVERVGALRTELARHREAGAWQEASETIRDLIRAGVESGDPDEDEQLELLVELGRIEHEHLAHPDEALEAWRSAQTIDAADPRVLDAMEALFVQQGRWADCVELLEKRAALTEGVPQRIALLLNLAAMAHERLDDEERAIEAYERILKWDPEHEVASQQLESLYWSRKQWEPLATLLLDRASRHADPQARIAALEAVAQMYEDKVGDARAAFLVWLAVFRREPDRPHLVDQLDRLAPTADAWDELVAECSALAEELAPTHPEAAASLWHLVARWSRDRLANHDAAIRALEHTLRLSPTDIDALYELLDLLRADMRWPELVSVLVARAQSEDDRGRRSELYAELGEIHETRLAQAAEAIAFYERALADEPESVPVLVALHRLYLASEAWPQLAALLPRLIDALSLTSPSAVILDLYVELGGVLADRMQQPAEAARAYRDALSFDPQHAGALAGLQHVSQATGDTEALLDATESAIDAANDATQPARYADVAAAWHEHGRYDRAIACWQKAIETDPRQIAAHQGLARTLRAAQRWGPLVVALHVQLRLLSDPAERTALLLDLADVFESKLGDIQGGIAAYREVIALDENHRVALDALARLYERGGKLQAAQDALQRLLDQTADEPRLRPELLQRMGHLQLAAQDAANARLSFVQALAIDRDNARAREGLARVQILQGELVAAGEELVRAAQLSDARADQIRCFADAAWLYRHRLADPARARECLHLILELDPEHADAKQALAELLAETQQWETLWPHLEEQVARVHADASVPADERLDILRKAARCALELGSVATALSLYDEAVALDASPATQLDRADAQYRTKQLEAASESYQTIVARHAAALDRAALTSVYRHLAVIHAQLGKAPQAHMFHNKVLDLEPGHRDTLLDLTELHLARGHAEEAIATLRTLSAQSEPADRVRSLERIGDLYRDKLNNRPRAMSTYVEALELDGTNHRILQRLLDLQSETGQWSAAVETIGRFLAHEQDPARRGAYFLAAAEIKRTELKDKPGAFDDYEHALDELLREQPLRDATRTRAFEVFRTFEQLATADQAWKHLEQAYRRMIKRLPAGDPALLALWHGLGDIYRTRLEHVQSAIEAYEVAHSLDPEKSPQRARLLAELYARTGANQPEHVLPRAAKLVEVDPSNPDAYRALGVTALESGRVDDAWCVARALVFLKKANSKEQALYRQYQSLEVKKASGILDDDAWAQVRHPDEDRRLSAIFALVAEGAIATRSGPAKSFELKSKERMPVEHDTRVVAKIFRHAARVLNVSLPEVYVQPRRAGRLLLANVIEKTRLVPTVIVGRDLMTGYRDTEIAAGVGMMIAHLRPAYYAKLALATLDELEALLAAAAQLAGKRLGRPELEPLVTAFVPEIQKRLARSSLETLQALVARLGETPDVARWRVAVDLAVQRAALLVSGDLAATARMVSSETALLGALRPQQRVHELVAYSVSPAYFAVRRHLDVGVA